MKKAVLFDIDGTIWDSTEGVLKSWNEVLRRHEDAGCQMTLTQLQGYMGKTISVIAGLLLPHLPKERALSIMQEAVSCEIDYLRLHPGRLYDGIEEVFSILSEEYELFIISNCQNGYIECLLDDYQLHDYFTDCECSGRTGKSKGENIRLVMERNGITEGVYIGDTQGDLEAAKEAGIPLIFAGYGFGNVNENVPCADTPEQIPELVAKGLGKNE